MSFFLQRFWFSCTIQPRARGRCGTCQEFSPIWEEARASLGVVARFGSVNIDEEGGMARRAPPQPSPAQPASKLCAGLRPIGPVMSSPRAGGTPQ